MLIGYARVSTDDQDLALQKATLKEAGCRRIYEEKVSGRVLVQHRQEFADFFAVGEADEQRDRGAHHPLGLGHDAGAAAEAGEPVALPGVVALDPVRLLLADEQPPWRDQLGVGCPVVRAVEARVPALHPREQSAQGSGVTTPALPINHSA